MENKEKYCPNLLYDSNGISIGEFKTIEECMDFPIHGIWCINRNEDNLFGKYKSNGYRVLIICSWNRGDRWRFVVALKKGTKTKYFDLNDLPMDLVWQQYEQTLGNEALSVIKSINENINCNRNMKNNKIKLTESQLHKVIKESIKKVLNESKKKDPMSQWFKDFDKASKYRETMDYIGKGGQNPNSKKGVQESSALDTPYFTSSDNPNTKEGYLKLLFASFINDGMNAIEALDKAQRLVSGKYGS